MDYLQRNYMETDLNTYRHMGQDCATFLKKDYKTEHHNHINLVPSPFAVPCRYTGSCYTDQFIS
jgi:hypothetical protein